MINIFAFTGNITGKSKFGKVSLFIDYSVYSKLLEAQKLANICNCVLVWW